MPQKKTPATTEVMTSAPYSAIVADLHRYGNLTGLSVRKPLTFTPRQARALALLGSGHWVTRETFDREAGASNGPDLIQQLRRKLGHDAIETQHFDALDRDGKPCRPGRYRLTEKGCELLAAQKGAAT